MTAPVKVLTTQERGLTRNIHQVEVGHYVWHRGAFRRVSAITGQTLRMGRYALHVGYGHSVEVAR